MRLLRPRDDPEGRSALAVVGCGEEDSHAVIELTQAAGVDFVRPPDPLRTDPHEVLAFVGDPDGYRIGFVQDTRPASAADGDLELSNYLIFTDDCEAALRFYEACGLGQITEILRYGQNGMPMTNGAMAGKVMRARFAGPGVSFYVSDNDDAEPMRGSAHIRTMLCARGIVRAVERRRAGYHPARYPARRDFYSKLTGRFGVQWMLNCVEDLRRAK